MKRGGAVATPGHATLQADIRKLTKGFADLDAKIDASVARVLDQMHRWFAEIKALLKAGAAT